MSDTASTNPAVNNAKLTATAQTTTFNGVIGDLRIPGPVSIPRPVWDISQLRLPQNYSTAGQETVQASIPVGRPGPQTYFQAHPEWQVHLATLSYEDCLYLLPAVLHEALEGDCRIKLIVPYITRDGDIGLWPITPLEAIARTDTWTASAHRVLAASRQGWVRMRSNMRLRSYDLINPKAIWDEPVWPEQSFDELLQASFQDRVIGSLDHPVLRMLQGEA